MSDAMPSAAREVPVTIAAGDALAPDTVAAIEAYAIALATQLGAPVRPRVTARSGTDDGALLPGERFRLTVGDESARSRLTPPDAAGDLVADVSRALFDSRVLLFPSADVAALRASLGAPAWVEDEMLLGAARLLALLGVRVSRATWPSEPAHLGPVVDEAHDAALALTVECDETTAPALRARADELRDAPGVPVPAPQVRAGALARGTFRLALNDVWLPTCRAASADASDADVVDAVTTAAAADVAACGAMFVSGGLVDVLLASLWRAAPAVVTAVRERYAAMAVADVLRRLLSERVPLDDVRTVLESLLAAAGRIALTEAPKVILAPPYGGYLLTEPPPDASPLRTDELAEIVRRALGGAMRFRLSSGATLAVYRCSTDFELEMRRAARDGTDDARRAVVRRLLDATGPAALAATADAPVVVATSPPTRRWLRALLEIELPNVLPITWYELPADTQVTLLGEVT